MPPHKGFSNRLFNEGEKPNYFLTQYAGLNKDHQYFYLRLGRIEYVDLNKYEMTITWVEQNGVRDTIPISFAHSGPASCLGALPERGSIGVFAFYNEGSGKGSPLCVGFLPAGLASGIDHNTVKILPDALSTSDINEIQYRFRKLTPGEMIMACSLGSSIFLNKNIELKDSMQDTIWIREDDQSIVMTSLNNFIFADGISASAGPAIRNDGLLIYDAAGNRIPNNGSTVSLLRGKDNTYIVPFGADIKYGTQFYTEYRIDADELSDGRLDFNNINSSSPLSTRDPIVTMAMGNYIGADKSNRKLYGHILKARLFASSSDIKGKFSLENANQNNSVDEPSVLGMAYALHFLKTSTFIGVDKEGHYYLNLNASVANPLGAGRSMSILAQGNLKEIWGSTTIENNSWDLVTKGGVKWNIGSHNDNANSRSIDIKTNKGISIEVGGNDDSGYAKTEVIKGNVSESLMGNKETSCKNLTMRINGLKSESISGSAYESVQGPQKEIYVSHDFKETVIGEKNSTLGNRKTNIVKGGDELTVIGGNISETIMTFGNKTTSVSTGFIEQKVGLGLASTKMTAVSYNVNLKGGAINIKTSVGTVSVSGTTASIKGSLLVNIDAPIVRVGKNAPIGGAMKGLPGVPSHFDPVVGIPGMGSFSVGLA